MKHVYVLYRNFGTVYVKIGDLCLDFGSWKFKQSKWVFQNEWRRKGMEIHTCEEESTLNEGRSRTGMEQSKNYSECRRKIKTNWNTGAR